VLSPLGTCATGEVPHPFNRLDNLGPRFFMRYPEEKNTRTKTHETTSFIEIGGQNPKPRHFCDLLRKFPSNDPFEWYSHVPKFNEIQNL